MKSDISRKQLIRCEDDVDEMLLNATINYRWERRSMLQKKAVEVGYDSELADEERVEYVSP